MLMTIMKIYWLLTHCQQYINANDLVNHFHQLNLM